MNSSLKTYLTQRPLAMAGLVVSLAVLLICQLGKTSAPVTRTIANSVADTSTTATSLSVDKQSLPDNASDLLLKPHQQLPEIELVPIEQIKVGMRVPALNPEVTAEERATFKDPDPATWQLMELEHEKPDGGVLLISMLRPIEWIHQQGIHTGGSFQIDMPELGAKGLAKVLALKPCPEIQAGLGHVVLSTFAHPATHEILDVTIGQGEDAETIGVTDTHPFWSVQDQAFVPIGHLVAGSQVLTADEQTKTITSILPRPGPAQQVYNLEVNGEHVYYVGQQQLLAHNSCGPNVYAVVDPEGRPVYIGTGTADRVKTANKRVADALGTTVDDLKSRGFELLQQDMGSKAGARAAENWLILQAKKAGMEFTAMQGDYIDGNLLNKNWGTDWTRTAKGTDEWFDDFWPAFSDRNSEGWTNIATWFTF